MDGGLGLRWYVYLVVLRSAVDDFVGWNLCPVFQSMVSYQHHSPATYRSASRNRSGSAANRPIPRFPGAAIPSSGGSLSRARFFHTQSGPVSNRFSLSSIDHVLDGFLFDVSGLSRWECTDAVSLCSARIGSVPGALRFVAIPYGLAADFYIREKILRGGCDRDIHQSQSFCGAAGNAPTVCRGFWVAAASYSASRRMA